MTLLIAMHHPIEAPGKQALVLFGMVAAVVVAKAYAEICDWMLKSGKLAAWADIRATSPHSQTVLLVAKRNKRELLSSKAKIDLPPSKKGRPNRSGLLVALA